MSTAVNERLDPKPDTGTKIYLLSDQPTTRLFEVCYTILRFASEQTTEHCSVYS